MENKENGKTYSAINFLINQKLAHNYRIITNVHSFNIFNDSIFMDKIEDIIKYCTSFKDNDENVIIFFDEIFTILEKILVLTKTSFLLSLNYVKGKLFSLQPHKNGRRLILLLDVIVDIKLTATCLLSLF